MPTPPPLVSACICVVHSHGDTQLAKTWGQLIAPNARVYVPYTFVYNVPLGIEQKGFRCPIDPHLDAEQTIAGDQHPVVGIAMLRQPLLGYDFARLKQSLQFHHRLQVQK